MAVLDSNPCTSEFQSTDCYHLLAPQSPWFLFLYSSLTCWCSTEDPLLIPYTFSLIIYSGFSMQLCVIDSKVCIYGPDLTLKPVYPFYSPYLNFWYVPLPWFPVSMNTVSIHMIAWVRNLEIILESSLFSLPHEWYKKQI